MNKKLFFDRLLYIITSLEIPDIDAYFHTIGFNFHNKISMDSKENIPFGLIFTAKSIGPFYNVYSVKIFNDKIVNCNYVTRESLDLEELIEYASEAYGFSVLDRKGDSLTILSNNAVKCHLHKNFMVNHISYTIELLKLNVGVYL